MIGREWPWQVSGTVLVVSVHQYQHGIGSHGNCDVFRALPEVM